MSSSSSYPSITRTPSLPFLSPPPTLNKDSSSSTSSKPNDSSARRRHKQKDDAIRRKVDNELARKGSRSISTAPLTSSKNTQNSVVAGTVASLRPSPSVTIRETKYVLDAAQLMAGRRCDALLVVDDTGTACGIITDKDLAFRVIAQGLDMNSTKVFQVMTKDVKFCNSNDTAPDALNTMLKGSFRHLPVKNDLGQVTGILDITKCLYHALERINSVYGSAQKLSDALEDVQRDWASSGMNHMLAQQFEVLRQRMLCPDLNSVMDGMPNKMPPCLTSKDTVKDAAKAMQETKSTAVLVFDEASHHMAGIFTSKDIVLRVMSVKADPAVTSVNRVKTPHPDTVSPFTTVYDALKLMHTNRYLHLPVTDPVTEKVIGLVDVLTLTYSVLEKIKQSQDANGKTAWDDFWTSPLATDPNAIHDEHEEMGSQLSELSSGIRPENITASTIHSRMHSIRPQDSASVISGSHFFSTQPTVLSGKASSSAGASSVSNLTATNTFDSTFTFKFRDPSTMSVHRITSPLNLAYLVSLIKEKLGNQREINSLIYSDEDGDSIAIESDADLGTAVALAKQLGLRRLILTVNGVAVESFKSSGKQSTSGGSEPLRLLPTLIDSATDLYAAPKLEMDESNYVDHQSHTMNSMTLNSPPSPHAYGSSVHSGHLKSPSIASTLSHPIPPLLRQQVQSRAADEYHSDKKSVASGMDFQAFATHPVVLVGVGIVSTLSVIGLASFLRK